MIHCTNCGTANSPTNQNCIGCGNSLKPGGYGAAAGQGGYGQPGGYAPQPGGYPQQGTPAPTAPAGGGYAPQPGQNPNYAQPGYGQGGQYAPQPSGGYNPPPAQAAPTPAPSGGAPQERRSSPGGRLVGVLVSFEGSEQGELWVLRAGFSRIGRKDAADGLAVQIDNPTVSSNHAVLSLDPENQMFKIEDTQSANGTLLNGKPIAGQGPREVRDGDRLRFGAYNATLKLFTGG